jgi:hypothetical protein
VGVAPSVSNARQLRLRGLRASLRGSRGALRLVARRLEFVLSRCSRACFLEFFSRQAASLPVTTARRLNRPGRMLRPLLRRRRMRALGPQPEATEKRPRARPPSQRPAPRKRTGHAPAMEANRARPRLAPAPRKGELPPGPLRSQDPADHQPRPRSHPKTQPIMAQRRPAPPHRRFRSLRGKAAMPMTRLFSWRFGRTPWR